MINAFISVSKPDTQTNTQKNNQPTAHLFPFNPAIYVTRIVLFHTLIPVLSSFIPYHCVNNFSVAIIKNYLILTDRGLSKD